VEALHENNIETAKSNGARGSGSHVTEFGSGIRIIGALGLAAVFCASFLLPAGKIGLGVCAFKEMTGLPCPGCGLTRSFISISHGQFAEAFRMHPLGPFIYLALGFYMVKWGVEAALGKPIAGGIENRFRVPVLWGFIALMLVIWLARLISGTLV